MPSKKKKYNARFPAGRIKKIMQSDEEIGKVAQAVPVIISRTLELFVESLLTKTLKITQSRNAKTLSTSHMKQCIMAEQRFDFLRELVKNIPDISVAEESASFNDDDAAQSSPEEQYPDSDTPYDLSMPSTSSRAINYSRSASSNGYTRSQSTNGAGNGHSVSIMPVTNLKRDYSAVQRLQEHIESKAGSIVGGASSVIMHTQAVANLVNYEPLPLPTKLLRSESIPAAAALSYSQPRNRPRHLQQQQQQHQAQMAAAISGSTATSCIRSRRHQSDTTTAIPEAIVNYELSKPIVKIDYSNLKIPQIATAATAAAAASISSSFPPLSAPPQLNVNADCATTAFDFAAASPVINIDLSNIVTSATNPNPTPAIATISIGALPATLQQQSSSPSSSPSINKYATNSKAKMAAPFSLNTAVNVPPPKPATTTAKEAFFELDEDYDNI